jgi:hypothetical protein
MAGLNARRAAGVLADDVKEFERLGYRPLERSSSFAATLAAPGGGRDLVLRLHREGRVFGGNWALEITTAEPVLPASERGLSGRGRGMVHMQGVRFRAHRGDDAGAAVAEALSDDAALGAALGDVHFEHLAVDRDGHPVIRHLGGSLVWFALPPVRRATPLPPGQPEAIVTALDAFARAGERLSAARTGSP